MSAYVSIVLHSAHYRSTGDFWQRLFGGQDNVALTSKVTYRYGSDSIEAQAVQDSRQVKANRDAYLGISRLVALKVPADADGLELSVSMTAVKDDKLGTALSMLNSDDFKKPLQLAPRVVGEVAAISNMVKQLFSTAGSQPELDASYAGIIDVTQIANPVDNSRLTAGYLVMISNEDDTENILDRIAQDPTQLEVKADGVQYASAEVKATYVVFQITTDAVRGLSPHSPWYAKFQQALEALDEVPNVPNQPPGNACAQALQLWHDGAALLASDAEYLPSERDSIATAGLAEIVKRCPTCQAFLGSHEVLEISTSVSAGAPRAVPNGQQGISSSQLLRATDKYSGVLSLAGLTLSWDHVT